MQSGFFVQLALTGYSVSSVHDHSRRIEMIGMDIVNLDRASGSGFSDYGHWNILQPDGFLTHQPIIGWGNGGSIVPVFPDQLPIGIIEKQEFFATSIGNFTQAYGLYEVAIKT